jgi:alkanesulfonate monooxygenase SsuD/methylene tetrahydromethanopterin reductase-like flavin-dependent oxidoreductase (luciferase family)
MRKGDWAAVVNALDTKLANAKSFPPALMEGMQARLIAGWGGYRLIGTREQVVDVLASLSRDGLDGVLLSLPRFISGMREFRTTTYPLVEQAGLRDDV